MGKQFHVDSIRAPWRRTLLLGLDPELRLVFDKTLLGEPSQKFCGAAHGSEWARQLACA